jgi:hypothetical protein
MPEYALDQSRIGTFTPTGILVRAYQVVDGCKVWGNHDIAYLAKTSLIDFLQSRGQKNEWAEQIVLLIMGHS